MPYYAYVHCDCYEKGEMNSTPPDTSFVIIGELGEVTLDLPWAPYYREFGELEQWIEGSPCQHDRMLVCSEVLADYDELDAFKQLLRDHGNGNYPTLLEQLPTMNDGHTPFEYMASFSSELTELKKEMARFSVGAYEEAFQKILAVLEKVVQAAITTRHPISWG